MSGRARRDTGQEDVTGRAQRKRRRIDLEGEGGDRHERDGNNAAVAAVSPWNYLFCRGCDRFLWVSALAPGGPPAVAYITCSTCSARSGPFCQRCLPVEEVCSRCGGQGILHVTQDDEGRPRHKCRSRQGASAESRRPTPRHCMKKQRTSTMPRPSATGSRGSGRLTPGFGDAPPYI